MTASTEQEIATVAEIRAHFPALDRIHAGERVAYFDGPGGTQVPRAVADAMTSYLYEHNANTYWEYPSSAETDAIILASREALADFLNATSDEIAFGANMTTLTFHLARAIGRRLTEGDEIVVTELDHHANIAPWTALARERKVTVRSVRLIPETGQLDWDHLERQITPRTRVLAIGAASNALGSITDVRRAGELAHAVGALVFVDAVHYAAHAPVDVRLWDCDFAACSAYKLYGPHIGVLYGKLDRLDDLDVPKLYPAPDNSPDRMETGTQNHEGIAGAGAAVDWIASVAANTLDRRSRIVLALEALHARNQPLFTNLWDALSAMLGVRLFGPPPNAQRTHTVSFVVDGVPAVDVVRSLAKRGVFATHGDFYATTIIERLGQSKDGVVRAGLACYTTDDEVNRLIAGVQAVAGR
ncbi:MAG: cysteine desulfurase-like protein [Anaerolineae bacterium]|nr:cysteine desulfurase-like protein [Gemmatimonadaceae bacterium]